MGKTKRFVKWGKGTATGVDGGFCWRVTKNKVIETQASFTRSFWDWFRFCTQFSRKGNTPGFCLSVELLWFRICFEAYDRRMWDHREDKFLDPDPEPSPFKYF